VLRSGLRRLSILFVVLFVGTSVVSLVIGALAHANPAHAVADGFYVVGSAVLIGSFVFGIRGPLRAEWGDPESQGARTGILPRAVRRATPEERDEGKHNSLALFALGLALLLIGGAFDPTRRIF
jgi:hypothetical protein